MAEGRLLKKSIANDERVAQLSPDSQHLFVRAIPFQDNEGRMPGDPGAVRELVAPLLPWSDNDINELISEWATTVNETSGHVDPLVLRYQLDVPCRWRDREAQLEFECRLALQFAGFKNQPSRLRRGAPSSLPPHGDKVGQWASGPVGHDASGPPPAQRSRARARGLGSSPREVYLGGASKPAAATLPESIEWLTAEVERAFGRRLLPLRPSQLAAAASAVDRAGRDLAARVIAEKARAGLDPKSLAYFVPVLEDAAAGGETVAGATVAQIYDLADRLEARGL